MQLYAQDEENTPLTLAYASFWTRLAAFFIDALIMSLVMAVVLSVLGLPLAPELDDIENRLKMNGISAFIGWLYYAGFESSAKQATLGKQMLGIFVTDSDGYRISFARASGRYFGKMLSGLILLIGYLMAAFTARRQALHDKLANTLVLQHPGNQQA
ncbi:RDD family protein [Pontibacter actiniarum]|uniref:RDD family protein n=1 Tax=Pontibacter actiniarum TaxID=323450 RepID=A0A1X9YTR4_9BACT|nr:RDD family protein [Pontibacter actiniarum]ARS36211.1 RDD family protein [Pontibacter actiniarum]